VEYEAAISVLRENAGADQRAQQAEQRVRIHLKPLRQRVRRLWAICKQVGDPQFGRDLDAARELVAVNGLAQFFTICDGHGGSHFSPTKRPSQKRSGAMAASSRPRVTAHS